MMRMRVEGRRAVRRVPRVLAWVVMGAAAAGCALAGAAQRSDIVVPNARAFPESLTSGADGTIYVGSVGTGTIFRALPGARVAQPWIRQGTNGTASVFGVLADERSNTLWACSNDMKMPGIKGDGHSALKAFDLKTGAPKGSYTLPGKQNLCNDIAVAPDGSVFVSDSFGARVLRLNPRTRQLEVWVQDDKFGTRGLGVDGIAFGGDGQLYVGTVTQGKLFRVAVLKYGNAGAVTRIDVGRKLDSPDGLRRLTGDTFLLVEGGGRLDRVTVHGDRAKLSVLKQGLKGPTAVTRVGSTAWVAQGQLSLLFRPPHAKPHAQATPLKPWIVAVPLHP